MSIAAWWSSTGGGSIGTARPGAGAERVDMRSPSLRATIHPADGARVEYRFRDAPAAPEAGSEPWRDEDIVLTWVNSRGSLVDRACPGGRYEVDGIDVGRDFASVRLVGRGHVAGIRKRFILPALFDAVVVCHDLRHWASNPQLDGAVSLGLPCGERGAPDLLWAAVESGGASGLIDTQAGESRLVTGRPHAHMVIGSGPPNLQRIRSLISWGDWAVHGDRTSDDWEPLNACGDQVMR